MSTSEPFLHLSRPQASSLSPPPRHIARPDAPDEGEDPAPSRAPGSRPGAAGEHGRLLVLTGAGKGKTCAAFGVVARALGHGLRVGIVHFGAQSSACGEELFFRTQPKVRYCTPEPGRAWERAAELLRDPALDLVLMDDLRPGTPGAPEAAALLQALGERPALQHVVITGRDLPPELLRIADTVTELRARAARPPGERPTQKGVDL